MVGSLLSNRPRVVDSNCRVSCLAFAFAADLALADSAVSLVKAASAGSGVSPPIGAASGSFCGAGSAEGGGRGVRNECHCSVSRGNWCGFFRQHFGIIAKERDDQGRRGITDSGNSQKQFGVVCRMPSYLSHYGGNFRKREGNWSDKVGDDGMTFADEPSAVEKGTFQGALKSLVGAIIAGRLAASEQSGRGAAAHGDKKVGEANGHRAAPLENRNERADACGKHVEFAAAKVSSIPDRGEESSAIRSFSK